MATMQEILAGARGGRQGLDEKTQLLLAIANMVQSAGQAMSGIGQWYYNAREESRRGARFAHESSLWPGESTGQELQLKTYRQNLEKGSVDLERARSDLDTSIAKRDDEEAGKKLRALFDEIIVNNPDMTRDEFVTAAQSEAKRAEQGGYEEAMSDFNRYSEMLEAKGRMKREEERAEKRFGLDVAAAGRDDFRLGMEEQRLELAKQKSEFELDEAEIQKAQRQLTDLFSMGQISDLSPELQAQAAGIPGGATLLSELASKAGLDRVVNELRRKDATAKLGEYETYESPTAAGSAFASQIQNSYTKSEDMARQFLSTVASQIEGGASPEWKWLADAKDPEAATNEFWLSVMRHLDETSPELKSFVYAQGIKNKEALERKGKTAKDALKVGEKGAFTALWASLPSTEGAQQGMSDELVSKRILAGAKDNPEQAARQRLAQIMASLQGQLPQGYRKSGDFLIPPGVQESMPGYGQSGGQLYSMPPASMGPNIAAAQATGQYQPPQALRPPLPAGTGFGPMAGALGRGAPTPAGPQGPPSNAIVNELQRYQEKMLLDAILKKIHEGPTPTLWERINTSRR